MRLIPAGRRGPASPNGQLEDNEVFTAWRYAKREGYIPDDDSIPRRALQYVGREHGHADADDLTDDTVRQLARSSIYTWELTNLAREADDSTGDASLATTDATRAPTNDGDRPPDDAD